MKVKPVVQGQYTLALLFFFSDFHSVSRAAVPDGQCPVECRGYFVHSYVLTSYPLAWELLASDLGLEALARRLWLGALA